MRFLRISVAVLLVLCMVMYVWTTVRYKAENNTQGPELVCQSDTLELSVESGEEALMQGLSASDVQDGDLTGKILLASKSFFLEPGVFEVEYVVFDSHQNSDSVTRRICYTDYTAPKFGLTQPLVFTKGDNIRYLNYVTASDVVDGDITEQIKVKASDVSNYTAGTYPVLLEVSNSFGDTVQVELMVVVRDKNTVGPVISLSDYLVYVPVGGAFDPYELITSVVAVDGTRLSSQRVQVLGSVDTQTPGSYQLIYSCTYDGYEGTSYLTVVIAEEVA